MKHYIQDVPHNIYILFDNQTIFHSFHFIVGGSDRKTIRNSKSFFFHIEWNCIEI